MSSLAVLFDFRIGAVLLMVLLPIEASTLFPHSIFGLTGLNPVNLLLLATLVSYLVRARAPGSMRILPRQLLWLYIVPIALAGLLGSRHAQDFVPALYDVNGGFAHFRGADAAWLCPQGSACLIVIRC